MLKASITLLSNYRPSSMLLSSSCWCCSSEATTLTFLCFFLFNVLSTGFLRFRFQFISRRFHFFSKESSEDFRFLWQNSCNDRRHKNTFTKQNSFFSETASPSIIPCGHKQHRRLRNINECARVCARVCESE